MGCFFPPLWEETVSQFIPDSPGTHCVTQVKLNSKHSSYMDLVSLSNAEVIGVSHHTCLFPIVLIATIFRKGAWAGIKEGIERGVGEGGGNMCLYSLSITPPSLPSVLPFFY